MQKNIYSVCENVSNIYLEDNFTYNVMHFYIERGVQLQDFLTHFNNLYGQECLPNA